MLQRLQHHFLCLTRESQYQVGDDTYTALSKSCSRTVIVRYCIAGVHCLESAVMDALKSQFHPHEMAAVYLFKKIKYIVTETVRARGYCYTADPSVIKRCIKTLAKYVHRGICVCKRLKICQVVGVRPFFGKPADLLCYRRGNGCAVSGQRQC